MSSLDEITTVDGPSSTSEQAAQRAESLGGYLERADSDAVLRDLEDSCVASRARNRRGLALGFAGESDSTAPTVGELVRERQKPPHDRCLRARVPTVQALEQRTLLIPTTTR